MEVAVDYTLAYSCLCNFLEGLKTTIKTLNQNVQYRTG
jgi:hypothetical protein